jgi:predicted nuclease of predicted toxin-antitoxin system
VRFLIDADLSWRLIAVFGEFGHDALHVKNIGLGSARDPKVAERARATDRCLFTGDFDFSNILEFKPRNFAGIVVLTLPRNATPVYITALTREFLQQLHLFEPLTGKLLIVEPGRIRVRE